MNRRVALALAIVLLLVTPVSGQTNFGADPARYLKLDWKASPQGPRTAVWGRVFNDYGLPARDIRLLVESLDPSGRPVGQATAWVGLTVAPGTTGYFETRVPTGSTYRVSVASFSWVLPDDMDFGSLRRP